MANVTKKDRRKRRERARRQRRARTAEENKPVMTATEARTRLQAARSRLAELDKVKHGLDYPGGLRMLESDRLHLIRQIESLERELCNAEADERRTR